MNEAVPLAIGGRVRPMARHRVWLVNAVVGLIVMGSMYDIVRDTDHWPFSNYPMYSELQLSPTLTVLRLFGVTDDASPGEFALLDERVIQPFDQARLTAALSGRAYAPERREQLTPALRHIMARYEQMRRAGRHSSPPLRAVRLYRLFWTLDPLALNVDRPDRKQLLFEVSASPTEGHLHD